MVEEELRGLTILTVLGSDDRTYINELHAALDKNNQVKDCRDVAELIDSLTETKDRHKTLIVAGLAAAVQLAQTEGSPANDFPMLVIAPVGHIDEYTDAMKVHHARFEYLNKVDSPDPHKLIRTLALLAKDGPLAVTL